MVAEGFEEARVVEALEDAVVKHGVDGGADARMYKALDEGVRQKLLVALEGDLDAFDRGLEISRRECSALQLAHRPPHFFKGVLTHDAEDIGLSHVETDHWTVVVFEL